MQQVEDVPAEIIGWNHTATTSPVGRLKQRPEQGILKIQAGKYHSAGIILANFLKLFRRYFQSLFPAYLLPLGVNPDPFFLAGPPQRRFKPVRIIQANYASLSLGADLAQAIGISLLPINIHHQAIQFAHLYSATGIAHITDGGNNLLIPGLAHFLTPL